MPFELQSQPDAIQLRLDGEVTIQDAAALHAALQPALAAPQPLVIDATSVARLDSAAIQVLLAAAHAASATRLTAPSAAWSDSFRRHALADPATQP